MNKQPDLDADDPWKSPTGDALDEVCGAAGAPIPQLQAPLKPAGLLAPPTPFKPPQGMAPPKYSAGWWDLVRARGLFK